LPRYDILEVVAHKLEKRISHCATVLLSEKYKNNSSKISAVTLLKKIKLAYMQIKTRHEYK